MKCIIVDDDPIALRLLKQLISKTNDLDLIGEFLSAEEALSFIDAKNQIDLIFLDIEMPGMTGIDFIRTQKYNSQVILVSGHTGYAAEAFEYNVTDFLTKPLNFERFLKSVEKALQISENIKTSNKINKTGDLYLKQGSRLIHINERDILYIEALADYVTVNCSNGEKYTILSTMKSIENKLTNDDFARIHRSFIIRLEKIKEIEDDSVSIGNQVLPISRSQKPILFEKLHLL
jgi:DNA-binding LytR/AlgR family response regulator